MAGHYYPPQSFHFRVVFNIPSMGKLEGNDIYFQSVSGLEVSLETEKIKEIGQNKYEHVLPTRTSYSDLSLKRGLLYQGSGVLQWLKDAMEFQVVPAQLTISLLNSEHEPMVSWNVVHAWPKKWTFGDFDAGKSEVMVETILLHYNYFTMS